MDNLGIDLTLDNEGDIALNYKGDLMTTNEVEKMLSDSIKFDGEICLRESTYRRLEAEKSSYPFDVTFGVNLSNYLCVGITPEIMNAIKIQIETELIKDDRIISIKNIEVELFDNNRNLRIIIEVEVIGQDTICKMVFPYSLV